MTDKELGKLRRVELLELLVELSEENEALRQQNSALAERLDNREIALRDAGSLAEASLRVSGVFQAAQEAAACYLENLRRMSEKSLKAAAELTAPPGQPDAGAEVSP